jgi:predicted nucleotidyltransferase component of viral defense system
VGQKTLTLAQKTIIQEMAKEPKLADFYLTGGTALAAYYLHHRISDDLDFFSFNEPDTFFIHEFVNKLKVELAAEAVRFEKLHDRNQFFFALGTEKLKVEFTKYPFKQLENPKSEEGLKIDSLRDIRVNKLMAMLERFDPKDFVDLYYLLQSENLENIRKDTETKFGIKIGGIFLGGELAKVRRIEALPKMLKSLTIDELKNFFSQQIKNLSTEVLK